MLAPVAPVPAGFEVLGAVATTEAQPVASSGLRAQQPLVLKEDEDAAARLSSVLFDQAALSAGRQLDNPAQFVQELNKLMFE